ncbi:MAG: DUF3857 domain-containing protein [Myxococcota bacterium]
MAFDVTATARVKALLVVGSNGPLEVWLDGASVLAFDGERSFSDWQHALPVDLARGPHHLVARVGHRSAAPMLSLRLVDGRGLRPRALGGTPGGATPGRALPELAATPEQRGRLRVWVTPSAHFEDDAADRALSASDPELAARVHDDDESVARSLLERARSASALAALVDVATRQGLPADADRFARALAALEPTHPTLLVHRALALLEDADAGSALAALDAGGQPDPRVAVNARLAATRATLLERSGRIPAAAAAWAQVARLLGGDADAVQRAVALYRRAGQDEQAIAAIDEALTRRPYLLDLTILKARTLAATQPADGLAVLDAVAAFHADRAALHETRGRLLLLAGDRGQAVAAFDRALELEPQNRDLADYRRTLVAERGLAETSAAPLAPVLAEARAIPLASQGVVALLERQVVKVFPSGLSSTFRQIVYRIDNDAAAQRFQSFELSFTPGEDRVEVLEAEIIRGNDKLRPETIQEVSSDGKNAGVYTLQSAKVVRFPPLQAGDIMHLQMRTDEVGSRNLFGDFFGVIAPLSADFPKRRVELVIEAPASRPLYFHAQGVAPPELATVPASGDAPAFQRLTLAVDNLPAIAFEELMPGYGEVGSWLSVSTFSAWEDLARWYRQLVKAQLEVPPELAQLAQKLAASAPDLRGKVAAIHGWVISHTRYVGIEFGIHGYKPYAVADIVKRGYGDCKDKASLIVALCHAAGIPAEFVLVRTRDLGALDGTPATLRAFNHAIAYIPGLDLYLDGTAELSGLDELPQGDQDAQVMRLDLYSDAPPTVTRIPMQPAAVNHVEALASYQLEASGDATALFVETIHGTEARVRQMLQDPTRRDQAHRRHHRLAARRRDRRLGQLREPRSARPAGDAARDGQAAGARRPAPGQARAAAGARARPAPPPRGADDVAPAPAGARDHGARGRPRHLCAAERLEARPGAGAGAARHPVRQLQRRGARRRGVGPGRRRAALRAPPLPHRARGFPRLPGLPGRRGARRVGPPRARPGALAPRRRGSSP